MRNVARIVGALITVVLGAFLIFTGCSMLWTLLSELRRPEGTTKPYFWVQIGTITIEGWQIYVVGALLLFAGVGSLLIGLSLFLKRNLSADKSPTPR